MGIMMRTDDSEEPSSKKQLLDGGGSAAPRQKRPMEQKNIARAYLGKQVLLEKIRVQIASLATSIQARPQESMPKLKELLTLLDAREFNDRRLDLIFITVQKLVAYSLLEIFKDILPGYSINESLYNDDEDKGQKNQKLKKETKELRQYECNLLKSYKVFLHRLARMLECLKGAKSRKSRFFSEILKSEVAMESIGMIGLRCASQLLICKPHFNLRKTLIEILLPVTCHTNEVLAREACTALARLYSSDRLGDLSLDGVKLTSQFIKGRQHCNVSNQLLSTFLALRVNQASRHALEEIQRDKTRLEKSLQHLTQKEKKKQKKIKRIENQLLETEAQESRHKKVKFQTDILSHVFMTYFRILKSSLDEDQHAMDPLTGKRPPSRFVHVLSPVLEGLSRFSALINVEFFDDLIALLFALLRSGNLSSRQSLHCLHTVFTIISGEGSALNVDPHRFYDELYARILPSVDITNMTKDEDFETLLSVLNMMLIRRRKQISSARVLSFAKRIFSVALQLDPARARSLIDISRTLCVQWPQCEGLFDLESEIAAPVAQQGVVGMTHLPNSSNQLDGGNQVGDGIAWEILVLRRHVSPDVESLTRKILLQYAPPADASSSRPPPGSGPAHSSCHADMHPTGELLFGLESMSSGGKGMNGNITQPLTSFGTKRRREAAMNIDASQLVRESLKKIRKTDK